MKKVRRFKFLREGLKSNHYGYQWSIGKWHKTECTELCHGFNCSRQIIDAMSYVAGEILAEVEVKGKHFDGDDKSTHEGMKIVRAWNWTKKDSVSLSIFSAELCLNNFESVFPGDDRPRKAIETAKKYLEDPTEENQKAARSAARSAAWSAAESTRSAAWSAAWSAAESTRSAAESAAWSAAWSARSAAWSAARSASESASESTAESAVRSAAWSAALDEIEAYLLSRLESMEEWKS